MSQPIHIQFSRFSAFYSPLIAMIAGGFLKEQGFTATYSVAEPGKSSVSALLDGTAQVVQSAPSQGFGPLEKGEKPEVVHFAQINEKDGFFLTARKPDPAFTWEKLASGNVLAERGGQPFYMFRYACHKRGVDFESLHIADNRGDAMDQAFRDGVGDYIHQQGPAPQQLEHDGIGHIVASVGEAIGPVAFSSLAATPQWLRTDDAKRFMRAYHKARAWVIESPPAAIALAEAPFFPGIDRAALAITIEAYQRLGCWTPHLQITRAAFEVAVDVFLHAGAISKRHDYDKVVVPPPGA